MLLGLDLLLLVIIASMRLRQRKIEKNYLVFVAGQIKRASHTKLGDLK